MKKILTKIKIMGIVLVSLLIIAVALILVSKFQGDDKPVEKPNADQSIKGNTEVIFSFDSYKEIIGTKPSLVNDFGATTINRDEAYITEGKGSWMVQPQGDYAVHDTYPYLRMKCYASTFQTNDFSGYDKVLMDVYNASDEDVSIKWRFKAKSKDEQYSIDTEESTYVLTAGEWTTCELDLSHVMYDAMYDLSDMQYMTIKFLTQKETKDDVVSKLYFDNLRGHLMEGERQEPVLNADFEKGISFENIDDRAYFWNNNGWIPNNNVLSRVAYKDTTIKPLDFMGEYVLRGDATASTFPFTNVNFDKTYTAGKYLSFMMYIEVDKTLTEKVGFKTWAVQSPGHVVTRGGGAFNKWIQVDIQLQADCSSLWFFPQFGWNENLSIFGQNPVTIYMDHFIVTDEVKDLVVYNFDFEKGITFEKEGEENAIVGSSGSDEGKYLGQWSQSVITLERTQFDGSYTMMGKVQTKYPEIFVPFNKTYPQGDTITFRYYVEGKVGEDETFKVSMRGYPGGDEPTSSYTVTNRKFNRWYETTFTFAEAHDRVSIFIELEGTSAIENGNSATIYFDDFYVNKLNASSIKTFDFEKGVTFEIEEQEEAIIGSSGDDTPRFVGQWSQSILSLKRKQFDGSYTMAGETDCHYPEAFIELGKTYPAGTTFTFRHYVQGEPAEGETYMLTMRGYLEGSINFKTYEVSARKFNRWYETTITFTEAHDRVALFMGFGEDGALKDSKKVTIYYDDLYINKENASSIKTFDFEKGITFEEEEQEEAIVGSTGDDTSRFVGQWSQTILSLSRKEFGGSYTMAGETDCHYPEAFIELGKTYPAGTTFTFRHYVQGEPAEGETYMLTMRGYLEGSINFKTYEVSARKFNRWYETTITFTEAHDRVALFMGFGEDGALKDSKKVTIYYDDLYINKEIDEPEVYRPDFEAGITFEKEEQEAAIVGSTGDNTDRFTGQWSQNILSLSRVKFDGSYTMMGKTNCQYPEAFVELGKMYPAGTTFTFRYYAKGNVTETETHKVVVVGYPLGDNAKINYEITDQKFNQWNEIRITFQEPHDRLALRVELAGTGAIAGIQQAELYFDDLYINKESEEEEQYTPDFDQGVTFENEADMGAISLYNGSNGFAGLWEGNLSNASLQIFNGSTQLAIVGANGGQAWPVFYVNFGKIYPAGTVLTFNCYYNSGGGAEGKVYEFTSGSQNPVMTHSTWVDGRVATTITITLANDCDRIAIQTSTWGDITYYDNFKVGLQNTFEMGVDFEQDSHLAVIATYNGSNGFDGLWGGNLSNASLQTFDGSTQLAITGANGGQEWPTFYVNFGKTYPAGTVLTFDCYYNSGGGAEGKVYECTSESKNPVMTHSTWVDGRVATTITITLAHDCDRVAIQTSTWGDTTYYDNFKVVTPSN